MRFTDKTVSKIPATNERQEISDGSGVGLMVRIGIKGANGDAAKTYYWRGRVMTHCIDSGRLF